MDFCSILHGLQIAEYSAEGNVFCEYNAGSGEFLVANIIDQILCAKKESVVLIDEPEVSLHPGAQKRLLKVILKSIIDKKNSSYYFNAFTRYS